MVHFHFNHNCLLDRMGKKRIDLLMELLFCGYDNVVMCLFCLFKVEGKFLGV